MTEPQRDGIWVDETGRAWQACPLCSQSVVPSYNGWKRHIPWCPGVAGPLDPDPLTVPEPEQDTGYRRAGCSILPFLAGLAFWAALGAVFVWWRT